MYGSVQAVFQYGITAPFRRPRRDPPAPELEQPQPRLQRIEDHDPLAEGDAPQQALRYPVDDGRLHRNQVRQRQPNRAREVEPRMFVQTLGTVNLYTEDEIDVAPPPIESGSENQEETHEEAPGAGAAASNTQTKTKPDKSDSAQSDGKDEPSTDDAEPRSQSIERPSLNDVEVSS